MIPLPNIRPDLNALYISPELGGTVTAIDYEPSDYPQTGVVEWAEPHRVTSYRVASFPDGVSNPDEWEVSPNASIAVVGQASCFAKRYRIVNVDADVTLGTGVDEDAADMYALGHALTNNRKWTLAKPTRDITAVVRCMSGNTAAFAGLLSGHTLTIANHNGAAVYVISAGTNLWCDMYYDGSNWITVGAGNF